LTNLYLDYNALEGTIPSSLCSISSLVHIYIDCGEITCDSGCCVGRDDSGYSSCG
jgi:hypothetical protein